ncbi:MAG TPA: GTPase HflX [Thermoanaerobaculia bacterium]|nr:GTPase HflX [Thermoanaerobaculia bacterium]
MPENVIAVALLLPDLTRSVAEEHLLELEKLIETAGGTVVDRVFAKRPRPDPATYVGSGKAEQIKSLVAKSGATLIVFDDDLSAAQARNLEKITEVKVIDRSGLILDIFAGRARSREARTQVELAQLEYMLPRLTRAWTHLERQAGGIGTRGVGETQLELDRRIIRNRIARLKEELTKIERTRETQRKSRNAVFTVALVGYTNAGKSTLFNRLTSGSAEAADKLFATLDAKSAKAVFTMPRETVIIDTVGFIRKLPHHLVASFRSTMEEAVAADLVLHVIDSSHPQYEDQRAVGDVVLRELGVQMDRVIEVYNKADLTEPGVGGRESGVGAHLFVPTPDSRPPTPGRCTVSALTGRSIDRLIEIIRERELENGEIIQLEIPHNDARVIAKLHDLAQVYEQRVTDRAMLITAWIPRDALHLFEAYAAVGLLKPAKVS